MRPIPGRIVALAALSVALSASIGAAQTDAVSTQDDPTSKPTEIGIRFTPEMARAISRKFIEQMKPRYDLDDKQADEIAPIIQRHLMRFAHENAELGRDMLETMVAGTIENDGRFNKDDAKRFAKLANKFMPKFREFMTQSSAEIAMKMTVTQRLKYTGDLTVFAAGLLTFENRMKKWEEGKIGEYAYPFFDPPGAKNAENDPEPIDPRENAQHRKARKQVESWIGWQINKDDRWQEYLDRSSKYYGYSDAQLTAAKSILKDCRDRAAKIKTPQWRQAAKENQILQQLSYGTSDEVAKGPWMASLEEAFKKMLRPLDDLDAEFKRRLDGLPDSTQRARARETVRKALAPKGIAQLPN